MLHIFQYKKLLLCGIFMKKIKIKLSFIPLLLILSLLISSNNFTSMALLAVLIHESGHIVASKLFKIELTEFSFGILGARLKTNGILTSYWQEILLSFFGPLFNFLTVIILLILRTQSSAVSFLIFSSAILGTLNLLPINTFDGGRIFKSLLSFFICPHIVSKIMNLISFFLIFTLWIISVYFMLIYTSSLGLFVFSLSLFCTIFLNKIYD